MLVFERLWRRRRKRRRQGYDKTSRVPLKTAELKKNNNKRGDAYYIGMAAASFRKMKNGYVNYPFSTKPAA